MAGIGDDERNIIRMAVWSGFSDRADLDSVIEDILLDEPDLDENALHTEADAEFARKAEVERTWPVRTDCDRLDAAFAALPSERILALHRAGFTMADGHVEAGEALDEGPPGTFHGYCFYHEQDIHGVIEGGSLWIAFDHVDGDVPAKAEIARKVMSALDAAGLKPRWEGDTNRRIEVSGFSWKRRYSAATQGRSISSDS